MRLSADRSILVLIFFSGCAAYQMPALTENHPAHLGLAVEERPVSKTLAYSRADIPSPQPIVDIAQPQQGGHDGDGQPAGGAEKAVTGEGRVVATVPGSSQLVVEHGAIKGFMDAMTMGYRVESPSLLDALKPGDQVRFTIEVQKKTIVKIEKLK